MVALPRQSVAYVKTILGMGSPFTNLLGLFFGDLPPDTAAAWTCRTDQRLMEHLVMWFLFSDRLLGVRFFQILLVTADHE